MAHELTIRANGSAEMAFVGETPWHGLGQQLTQGATIEEWATASGMDFRICRSRVRFGEGENQQIIDDKHVLFRCDNKLPLGIVSDKYKIVQPLAVLEFFRELTADSGFKLETAGTLFGGKKYWALASVGESAQIVGRDTVGGYLLLTTAADGTQATVAKFTTVRVVCNNTLSMSLSRKDKNQVSVSHRNTFDHAKVKDQLGIARGEFAKFVGAMRDLSQVKVTAEDAEKLTMQILSAKALDKTTKEEDDKVRDSRAFRNIVNLFNGAGRGSQMEGVAGTAWGLLNAVTEQVDHFAHAHTRDARLDSAFFGKGDELKTKAAETLLALV